MRCQPTEIAVNVLAVTSMPPDFDLDDGGAALLACDLVSRTVSAETGLPLRGRGAGEVVTTRRATPAMAPSPATIPARGQDSRRQGVVRTTWGELIPAKGKQNNEHVGPLHNVGLQRRYLCHHELSHATHTHRAHSSAVGQMRTGQTG